MSIVQVFCNDTAMRFGIKVESSEGVEMSDSKKMRE